MALSRFRKSLKIVGHKILAASRLKPHIGGPAAKIIELDLLLATAEQCQVIAVELANSLPQLDGLLHNAGLLGERVSMAQQSPLIWQQVMQVNVNAAFMLTQALLPMLLKAPRASLVFTSSSVGRRGRAEWGAYAVSKFATEGMMQVLAQEYQQSTLRVNSINPGGTRTQMRADAFPNEDPSQLKTPEAIMPPYLYLMSDESRQHNGISFDAQPHRQPGPAPQRSS